MLNTKFDAHLELVALEFLENRTKYSEILSIHHTDADGITAGAIIQQMLQRLKLKFKQISFNLDRSWKEFLDQIELNKQAPLAIIFSDLCPPGKELCDFLEDNSQIDIYILDHHIFRNDPVRSLPTSVYNCNPTQFGLHGLKQIVGSTLNFLFAKAVSKKNTNLAWLAAIGMGGDTLDHINDYQSYDRLVIDEAIELEQIQLHEGLCLFGGQFERIDKALSHSILPYIPQVEGDKEIAKNYLEKLRIIPKTKVEDLTSEEVDRITAEFNIPSLKGEYVTLPKKSGLLRHVFEHAQLISLIGHDNPQHAFQLLTASQVKREYKEQYLEYIQGIVSNLTKFMKMPKIETKSALIVDLTNSIPIKMWSDTGSFATINGIYDQNKILLIGGVTNGDLKLSVRCSPTFIENHNNKGANVVIKHLIQKFGGNGGGHGLAGGLRVSPSILKPLSEQIDEIISSM
jgi:single-stranded-DNA-specific exonuclease